MFYWTYMLDCWSKLVAYSILHILEYFKLEVALCVCSLYKIVIIYSNYNNKNPGKRICQKVWELNRRICTVCHILKCVLFRKWPHVGAVLLLIL